ncbi:hypothetical protein BMMON2_42320 [Burkholderia mallei]
MMLASSALRSPLPKIAAFSGVLKYSAIPFNCTGVTADSSHINRKNAIIAVMKSAYASFHAPPWCPFFCWFTRLTMIA